MIRALHVKQFHAVKNNIFRSSIEYLHERSTKSKFKRIKLAFRNGTTFSPIIQATWASAQRDGRPTKYRWRPLINAAMFRWRLVLECRAVTLPRRETRLKLAGVPQTNETISSASTPKFTILWERVGEILLFNSFFPIVDTCLIVRRYSPTKLCDGAQMANFWRFFGSCISGKLRAARFRPAF